MSNKDPQDTGNVPRPSDICREPRIHFCLDYLCVHRLNIFTNNWLIETHKYVKQNNVKYKYILFTFRKSFRVSPVCIKECEALIEGEVVSIPVSKINSGHSDSDLNCCTMLWKIKTSAISVLIWQDFIELPRIDRKCVAEPMFQQPPNKRLSLNKPQTPSLWTRGWH